MAPIRATEAIRAAPFLPKMEDWCEEQDAILGDYGDLAQVPWSVLRAFEIFPGSRLDAELLEIPELWMPAATSRLLGSRSAVPDRAGVPTDPHRAATRDESVRRSLLALWLWRNTARGVIRNKPGSWRTSANAFLRLAKWQFVNRPSDDGSIFGMLTLADLLTGFYPSLRGGKDGYEATLNALSDAGDRKVISDYPKFFRPERDPNDPVPLEPIRKGAEMLRPADPKPEAKVEPFPDEFVTKFVRRALWIQENVAHGLLDHLREDLNIRAKYSQGEYAAKRHRLKSLHEAPWHDAKGNRLVRLPFLIRQATRDGVETMSDAWPPSNLKTFGMAVRIVQGCNLGLVNLCTGARSSEILAADDVPFGPVGGRYQSITFKLVDQVGGTPRDWPLHPAAERAIEIQRRLSRVLRPNGEKHLWVVMHGGRGTRLSSATHVFRQTVEYLGLVDLLGSGTAHMHRWRHTVARLVALSVVGAPKVVFDLFGHKDLEMTLHYMMSDQAIAEESMRVAEETSYAMAEDAITETVEGKSSGPASASLREHLPMAMRPSKQVFDTESLRETAEVLTWQNKFWALVRPGVICTKGPGQSGPCTKGRGKPDPGGCRTSCAHRLELQMAKQQCTEALAALAAERKSALAGGLEMLVANLDGQILAELKRWDDVRQSVLAEHADIKRLWEESTR
jgi:integrase